MTKKFAYLLVCDIIPNVFVGAEPMSAHLQNSTMQS